MATAVGAELAVVAVVVIAAAAGLAVVAVVLIAVAGRRHACARVVVIAVVGLAVVVAMSIASQATSKHVMLVCVWITTSALKTSACTSATTAGIRNGILLVNISRHFKAICAWTTCSATAMST